MTEQRKTAAEALAAGRWREAVAGYTAVLDSGEEDPAAYEGLAQAFWWLDDGEASLQAREAAYRGHRDRGDDRSAARAATALGYDSVLFGLGSAVGRGWLARAADLLEGAEPGPEHGWLAVRQSETALAVDRDPPAGLRAAERAVMVGRDVGDGDLTLVGQALAGLAQVRMGSAAAGMARLDVAAAAATAGDVRDLMWMGKICCWLIAACQEIGDLARASEWCERVQLVCVRRDLQPLFSVCRIQYASLQIARGDALGAESTLVAVMEQLAASHRLTRLDAVVQLGELRRRQGRYPEAESLLRQAEFNPTARVSLALASRAQGDPERAWAMLQDVLATVISPPDRVSALAAAVGVLVDLDRTDQARAFAQELALVAHDVGSDLHLAVAAVAEAAVSDPAEAPRRWLDAVRRLAAAGLRFDEADARVHLAEALVRAGDERTATEHLDSAAAAYTELGAVGGLARTRRLRDRMHALRDGPLTGRQVEVLRLVAAGLTNDEIAARLQLSEHTVHRHVANILTALGLGSRSAATAYALTHDLI